MIRNLRKERSICSLRIPSRMPKYIYESAIIWTKEEIYGEFVMKETAYKYLVLLMEVMNV
jgi:hypothetical protein